MGMEIYQINHLFNMKEYTHQELAVKRRKLAVEYNDKMKTLALIKQRKAIEYSFISFKVSSKGVLPIICI